MSVMFGNLEITQIDRRSDSDGEALVFAFKLTTTRITAPETFRVYVGWKYAGGDGEVNYLNWWEVNATSEDVGTSALFWTADNMWFSCDHLFCGATYSFYLKAVSKDDEWESDPRGFLCASTFTLPTNNYMISERPTQQTQEVYYDGRYQGESGCCVACALTAAKEAQEMRCGKGVVQNSIGWFYGATAESNGGTMYEKALSFLRDTGMMPYRYVKTPSYISGFPDVYFYDDRSGYAGARSLYQQNIDTAKSRPQKIGRWNRLTGEVKFNWPSIFSAIQRASGSSSSVVVMTLGINQSMYNVPPSGSAMAGVMPFSRGSYRDGHMMLVLGWKSINGRLHFVCQNSWGAINGDDGIFYIPFVNVRTGRPEQYWTGICDFYELVDDPNAPDLPVPSVERWSWTGSNGSASAAQTRTAYTAVTVRGPTTDFSYLVWNDLVDKVNETAEAAGSSWSTLYATLSQARMTSSDKMLTAKRFNALRQNIGSHISTGIPEVSKGDTVKGSWFVILTEKLNQWIDKL